MWKWVLQANIILSLLVLLSGSQQQIFSWAPAATFWMLLSWGLTGMSLILFYNHHLLDDPLRIILYPLQIWLVFVVALKSPLAEAILFLPLSTTTAIIYLIVQQGPQELKDRRRPEDCQRLGMELPRPAPGPR